MIIELINNQTRKHTYEQNYPSHHTTHGAARDSRGASKQNESPYCSLAKRAANTLRRSSVEVAAGTAASATSQTMKVIRIQKHGGPEVLAEKLSCE
jgi:hypothetical protein